MPEPKPPLAEHGFVPLGESTRRCEQCGRDVSVTWLLCAISQLWPEEKYMIWRELRRDQALVDFREVVKRRKAIT
jgi:hypothetical protein